MKEEELRQYCKDASLEISNMQHTIDNLQSQLKAKEEEIEKQFKSMSAIIHHNSDLYLEESNKLIKERQQLKKVIKEAKEFINRDDICIDIRDNKLNYISTDVLDEILSKGENK